MKSNNLKIVFFSAMMIVVTQPAFSQYKSVILGAKIAPDLGWLKTDQDGYNNEGIVAGFGWGLVAEFYFAENYAFVSGFNFNFQNGKLTYPEVRSGAPGELIRNYRLKYIEIPALIKMKTNEISGFRFFGQIGLGGSIRLSSKGKDVFIEPGQISQTTDFRSVDSQTRLFKASMIVGAGVEYPFDNSLAFVAGINFNNGFSNALKGDNSVYPAREHKGVPNFIELSLAVMF